MLSTFFTWIFAVCAAAHDGLISISSSSTALSWGFEDGCYDDSDSSVCKICECHVELAALVILLL